ncbi:hypothetical protein C9374_010032 [Naegleria lovaniensis]|uniref:Guanylate cyclase domain-containing protein n=1 Tax=Naegleria lovaniensis TaxID=51637 RepID=A0AA88GHL9_NAELO|nr:uncharacterized protein C9374_010032 [Naegleria lovaniensis]KAG2375028.1 hypothetical protein C9374_010032 [Naegleria lovaniensis]
MAKIQPLGAQKDVADEPASLNKHHNEEDDLLLDEDDDKESLSSNQKNKVSSFHLSIRFCLIFLVCSLIMCSIVVLSATWLSSFSPTITELSSRVRDYEFLSVVDYANQTLREIAISSEMIAGQLGFSYNFRDYSYTETVVYRAFVSEKKHHDGVVTTTYTCNAFQECIGVIDYGGVPLFINTSLEYNTQYLYTCHGLTTDYCNRSSIPDDVTPPFDFTYLTSVCNANPGRQVYSLSYADPTVPDMVFVTLLNCRPKMKENGKSNQFDYFYALDLTTDTISAFLKQASKKIKASVGFIVEVETEQLIAVDGDVKISKWDDKGTTLLRSTPLTVEDPKIQRDAKLILEKYSNWKSIEKNTLIALTSAENYILVYHLVTDSQIDWILVLSVPIWNYAGSTAIAIIASVIGSLLVVSVGMVVGVLVSLRIVKPFYNLILLFRQISQMNLENIVLTNSSFSEVKELQQQFMDMVKKIKMYRAFIPSHLLLELDTGEGGEHEDVKTEGPRGMQQEHASSVGDSLKHINHASHGRRSSVASSSAPGIGGGYSSSRGSSSSRQSSDRQLVERTQTFRKRAANFGNKFSLHLEMKRISLMNVHIDGLNEFVSFFPPELVVQMLSDIFEQVQTISRQFTCQMLSFEGGSITLAFNASSHQANHELKANKAALQFSAKTKTIKEQKWRRLPIYSRNPTLIDSMSLIFAICGQQSLAGNVGTKDSKNFSVLSSARYNLEQLTKLARFMQIPIVVTDGIQKSTEGSFITRFIDTLELTPEQPPLTSNVNSSLITSPQLVDHPSYYPCDVHELLHDASNEVADEWMYELEAKKGQAQYLNYNEGVKLLKEGEHAKALEIFENFLVHHPQDKPTLVLIEKCQKILDHL